MNVLFDQNVPRNLRGYLKAHEVTTAAQAGWEQLKNGELLKTAEERGFDVFVTCDRNLQYQQTVTNRKLAIIEITKNNWPMIKPHAEQIAVVVDDIQPGQYRIVEV